MQTSNTDQSQSLKPFTVILTFVIIMTVWALSWFFISSYVFSSDVNKITDEETRGTFGDMFGAINSLFSGLAFAGIIITILLQSKELQLQRHELAQTRTVFTDQSSTLKLQQFESTFFNMLNLHHQIVAAIDVKQENESLLNSRDCFPFFYKEFQKCYHLESGYSNSHYNKEEELAMIEKAFHNFFVSYQSDLGHYWRNLYNILKFIDKKNPGDQYFYSNLLRAQLSSHELLLLFYNCLSHYGDKKFKPLIEKYYFLQNLPRQALLDMDKHMNLYEGNAFGRPDKS